MSDPLKKLDTVMAEVTDLRDATTLVSWDERVCMPLRGVAAHGEMLATIRRIEPSGSVPNRARRSRFRVGTFA
jgi:Zn-dependent M32 family carboxypeptidase